MEKITIIKTWEMGEEEEKEAEMFCDNLEGVIKNAFPEAIVNIELVNGADRTEIYTWDCTADDEDLIRELVQKTREDWEGGKGDDEWVR